MTSFALADHAGTVCLARGSQRQSVIRTCASDSPSKPSSSRTESSQDRVVRRRSRRARAQEPRRQSSSRSRQAVTVRGIRIPNGLLGLRNACFYVSGGRWILCTKKLRKIAAFQSWEELVSWWSEFQKSRGNDPKPPVAITMTCVDSNKPHRSRNSSFAQISDCRSARKNDGLCRTKPSTSPCPSNPGPDRVFWNDVYDMPEF